MNEANQPDELAILKANVAANPNNFDELLTLAEAYRQQQCYYDAIDTYKKAITLAPIDVDLYYSLGTIYESMGNIIVLGCNGLSTLLFFLSGLAEN